MREYRGILHAFYGTIEAGYTRGLCCAQIAREIEAKAKAIGFGSYDENNLDGWSIHQTKASTIVEIERQVAYVVRTRLRGIRPRDGSEFIVNGG